MIDFLKITITDAEIRQYFYNHKLLYFHSESEILLFDKESIVSKDFKQYKGILFEFTQYALFIHFKPHYYFNNNLHNANDFSFLNCIKALNEFVKTFEVEPTQYKIINIEFGLNVIIPTSLIDVKDLLFYLVYHNQNEFRTSSKYAYCRYSSTYDKNGKVNVYKIIKAYAKGVQFPEYTDLNTFRFEVKSNRKPYINSLGITTINDLLSIDIYNKLSETILKEFDDVLIIDDTVNPKLSKTKLNNFKEMLNPIYWHKKKYSHRNTFRDNFKRYYDALNTCDTHIKKELRNLISNKLNELKKCANFRLYKDEIRTSFIPRKCLVTGLNISMQKQSILLSHTGLKYYKATDKKIFEQIKRKHLTTNWIYADAETQIKEIAHNIRDCHRTQKAKQQRLYQPSQQRLFEIAI